MANTKPYYTTDDLIESVKRRISYPLSQNTFQYSDIVAFLNEEMQLSAVPAVKMEHEEYFVYKKTVPLVDFISRYEIPDRAIGMALRDMKYSDVNGNFYDMTRIAPDDKAFFQQSNGSNQTVAKFYIEGNEIVLTPLVQTGASGKLNFFFYLRPNNLVRNNRAAVILNYQKEFTFNNTNLQVGDILNILTGSQSPNPVLYQFVAINSSALTVVGITTSGVLTTTNAHNLPLGQNVNITFTGVSGILPDLNGTVISAVSTGANTFQLSTSFTSPGTGGSYSIQNSFAIGATSLITASNFASAVNASGITNISAVNTNTVTAGKSVVSYKDLSLQFNAEKGIGNLNPIGITFDDSNIYINFDQLPTTYLDPETDITTPLYISGESYVDFLQTNPGHRTYTYDIKLLNIVADPFAANAAFVAGDYASLQLAISSGNFNTVGVFNQEDLKGYQNNSSGGQLTYYNIKIGDYICLQHECIIPQIPPELHNALAERAASRILMAIGDVQGYQISQAKLAEMNKMQETLIGSRIESSIPKVFNRYSLLRLGKSRFRRRY